MTPYTVITSPSDLATVMRNKRADLKVTQEDLASLHALTRLTVINAESGQGDPKLSTITTLLSGLGLRLVAVPAEIADRLTFPETPVLPTDALGVDEDAVCDFGEETFA